MGGGGGSGNINSGLTGGGVPWAIARAVSLSSDRLCRACITGEYPTAAGQRLYQLDSANSSGTKNGHGQRAYERVVAASASVAR